MDRYIDITVEQLEKLHEALDILETLNREAMRGFDLQLFGVTQSPSVIDAAKEAIADSAETDITEEDVQLSEVAVAIPLGADTIYALGGSGIRLKNEEFIYTGEGGEGVRSMYFSFSRYKPTVALNDFSQLALASSNDYIDDFLRQYGNKQPAQIKQNVHRSEEATQPGVPAPAAPPSVPTEPATVGAPVPKQTSVHGGLRLAEALEKFLG